MNVFILCLCLSFTTNTRLLIEILFNNAVVAVAHNVGPKLELTNVLIHEIPNLCKLCLMLVFKDSSDGIKTLES